MPAPRSSHGRLDRQLSRLLHDAAERAGLVDTSTFNLGRPDDYRVPDAGYHRAEPAAVYLPTAAVVVEVVSPRDETYAKLPFYAARGVDEVLVVDPALRRVPPLAAPARPVRGDRPQRPARRDGGRPRGPARLALTPAAQGLTQRA